MNVNFVPLWAKIPEKKKMQSGNKIKGEYKVNWRSGAKNDERR